MESWSPTFIFEISEVPARRKRRAQGSLMLKGAPFASATSTLGNNPPPSPPPKMDTKPASDVIAGAVARAASQGTIHPLDTLKVRMQSGKGGMSSALSKIGKLVPPPGSAGSELAGHTGKVVKKAIPKIATLYRGVFGAASGAGIAIGAYFAFYGAATNVLVRKTQMQPGSIAFVAGAIAAAGGSVVKVPLAVCIRSVQAGVYPNAFKAASEITRAAGPRGLFTGYLPTLLEDVPDMAFKFAAYETMRNVHKQITSRSANAQEDFAMGAVSGAFAAAATTPLDVIKTTMMCTAASRPTVISASRTILAQGGLPFFFRGIGARAVSNGINSAVFFCFFEALRSSFAKRKEQAHKRALVLRKGERPGQGQLLVRMHDSSPTELEMLGELQPASASLAVSFKPGKAQQA